MKNFFKKNTEDKSGVVKVQPSKGEPIVGVHSASDVAAVLGMEEPVHDIDANKENEAAGKIQSFWRKKKGEPKPAPGQAKTAPAARQAKAPMDEDTAATKIQRFFRQKAEKQPELPRPVGGPVLVQKRTVEDEMAAFEASLAGDAAAASAAAAPAATQPSKPAMNEQLAATKIQRTWRKHDASSYPDLELKNRTVESHEAILSKDVAHTLRMHIPRRLRNSPHWTLLYSLTQHGSSMSTLYNNLLESGPVFLSIKTTKGKVFGAFVSEQIRVDTDSKGNVKSKSVGYYGTGESFLWRALPPASKDSKIHEHPDVTVLKDGTCLLVHPATQDNDYFISTQPDCIILGGGGSTGAVALYIGSDLYDGYSDGSSATYNMGGVSLAADGDFSAGLPADADLAKKSVKSDFQIALIEIWGFAKEYI